MKRHSQYFVAFKYAAPLFFSMVWAASVFADANFSGFEKRLAITFPGYVGSGALTNFPVLVRLHTGIGDFRYDDFAYPATGSDLRFAVVGPTGVKAEADYEIDTWNAGGTSLVWVRVPVLTAQTRIAAYYGNALLSAPAACNTNGAVWGSQYLGVWHLNAGTKDSSSNVLHAVKGSASTIEAGKIGAGCRHVLGTSSYVEATDVAKLNLLMGGTFTLSAWFKAAGTPQHGWRLFSRKSDYKTNPGFEMFTLNGNDTGFGGRGANSDTMVSTAITNGSFVSSSWVHITGIFNGTTLSLYSNGALLKSGAVVTATDSTKGLGFGNMPESHANTFVGLLDECRLSGSALSVDWIRTEFDVVNNSGFVAVESWPWPPTRLIVE